MKYFSAVFPTKNHFSIMVMASWKCLATTFTLHTISFLLWSHSQTKSKYFEMPQFIHCYLLSETTSLPENRVHLTNSDNTMETSLLPLLQIVELVASAASLPLLVLATICTGVATCLSQRTLPGSR